jgi:molybdopterin-biosynthesis enzyme MoeA-like protein
MHALSGRQDAPTHHQSACACGDGAQYVSAFHVFSSRSIEAMKTSHAIPSFGLIIVGDEILSGKRQDKHLSRFIELLNARGLSLSHVDYVGDDPVRLTRTLQRAFTEPGVVFSCGGIGATPDDHTRQSAALALGVALALHPEAKQWIEERARDMAQEQGVAFDPGHPTHQHRLNMGCFPVGADIIPNPYNKIPGFTCQGPLGRVHFVPGFPVMAWPMMEWVLDTHYPDCFQRNQYLEKSVIVMGSMEATLTPLMQSLEAQFEGIKVFSLPSVDHPSFGRHIELGVKVPPAMVERAIPAMISGLHDHGAKLGPEMVR